MAEFQDNEAQSKESSSELTGILNDNFDYCNCSRNLELNVM